MHTTKILLLLLLLSVMTSCGSYYKVATIVDRDGRVLREIYTEGDSAFLAGDMSHNPFLFDVDSTWSVTLLDSVLKYDFFGVEKKLNVKVSRKLPSVDLFGEGIKFKNHKKSFAVPQESLTKEKGLFYTNYTFRAKYSKLDYDFPVDINNYLSKDEQSLWTQGDFSGFKVMNGAELNEKLSEIERKFIDWFSRNCFEISLNCFDKWSELEISDNDKDLIYSKLVDNNREGDIEPRNVCLALDDFYGTMEYSDIYAKNKTTIDSDYEDALSVIELNSDIISYELLLPGKLITTNAPVATSNLLVWKVDGMRLLIDDYLLTASYRVMNISVIIIFATIFIMVAITVFILINRVRRKKG